MCLYCDQIHQLHQMKNGICPMINQKVKMIRLKNRLKCQNCIQVQQLNKSCFKCQNKYIYEKKNAQNQQQKILINEQWSKLREFWNKKIVKCMKSIDCAICLQQVKYNSQVYNLQCNHIFHLKCLLNWLKQNSNCPCCRTTDKEYQQRNQHKHTHHNHQSYQYVFSPTNLRLRLVIWPNSLLRSQQAFHNHQQQEYISNQSQQNSFTGFLTYRRLIITEINRQEHSQPQQQNQQQSQYQPQSQLQEQEQQEQQTQ